MTARFYVSLTEYGASLVAKAHETVSIKLIDMVIGDANNQPYEPSHQRHRTTLVNQRASVPIQSVTLIDQVIRVVATIESNIGGFNLHEYGFTDETGQLVYIANFHGVYKPIIEEGSGGELEIVTDIKAESGANVLIEVDPNVITANKAWVIKMFQQIYHIGSWHGTDQLNYDPSIDLESLFGYRTNWELRPYAPYGVADKSQSLLKKINISGNSDALATSTRIWKRLPDNLVVTISADKKFVFEGQSIKFNITADDIPDGTVFPYKISGENIKDNDISSGALNGEVVFTNNHAEISITISNSDDFFEDAEFLNFQLIGSNAPPLMVTIPVINAFVCQTYAQENDYVDFVLATRGMDAGMVFDWSFGDENGTFILDELGICTARVKVKLASSQHDTVYTLQISEKNGLWNNKGMGLVNTTVLSNIYSQDLMRFDKAIITQGETATASLHLRTQTAGDSINFETRHMGNSVFSEFSCYSGALSSFTVPENRFAIYTVNNLNLANFKKGAFQIVLIGRTDNNIFQQLAALLMYKS